MNLKLLQNVFEIILSSGSSFFEKFSIKDTSYNGTKGLQDNPDPTQLWQSELDFHLHCMPFGGPGSKDFKIDHDLMQICTDMGTHVSINA